MDEPVRWVTKAEAAEELEISFSTLDRKIQEVERSRSVREGRRVYVRMQGPEYHERRGATGHRAIAREDMSFSGPCASWSKTCRSLKLRASELARERDEAKESASDSQTAVSGA